MTWTQLNIKPGVIRQATPYDAPGTFWDTSNVRWVAGALVPTGGNTRITGSSSPSAIRKLFSWRDNSSQVWTAIGHESGAQVQFGSIYNITPTSFQGIGGIGSGGYGIGIYGQPEVSSPTSAVDDTAGTTVAAENAITITNASPAVITWASHGLTQDDVVNFTTTGTLPAGLAAGTDYYVIPIDANTFWVCLASGGKNGTKVNTTSAGSGTHTAKWLIGQDTYGRQRSINPPQFRVADFWSFASFGEDLLAVCSSDGRLLHFAPTTGTPAAMDVPSNAPTNNTAVVVTAERACMLIGAGGNKRRIQWSDFEDYNAWTASSTNQTGFLDLEASSPLMTGVRVKEGVLVLTQREAFIVRYVGAPYYYGVEKLGATSFSTPNAIAIGGNLVMWFGEESFWVYDGSSVRPLQCPFFNDLKQDYDPLYGNYRAHMHENGAFAEFWFDYPDKNDATTECSRYIIWNYAEDWWARGQRSVSASFGAQTGKFPIGAKTDRHVYQFDDGTWTDNGVSRVGSIWAETSLLPFNMQDSGLIQLNQAMVAVDPQHGSQNYSISIYSRQTGDQSEKTFGPYIPRQNGYTDMRASGRDLRMKVAATNDDYWSLGALRLDVRPGGGRR